MGRRTIWGVVGACAAILCILFRPEIAAAVTVWNESTAYGHCWLVLPIVAWLLWERRAVLEAGTPAPTPWPVLAAIPLAVFWAASAILGIMEGRQLAAVGFVELVLIAALGWRLWWSLSAAWLYLFFLVPFGAFLTPALQRFTTAFILHGLDVLDIPYEANAFQIVIPEGAFYVAEACAGLRFLIASVAFGVLYAVTLFRSPWRRAAFIAIACVVPVIANGFRGLGIVVLGHVLGSAQAGAADHLIYGWVFFSVVIVMLAMAGLPFREDHAPAAALASAAPARRRGAAMVLAGCAGVMVVAGLARFGAGSLGQADAVGLVAYVPNLVPHAGCRTLSQSVSGAVSTQEVLCDGARIRVVATTLPPRSNPSRILDAARNAAGAALTGETDATLWRTPAGAPWILLSAHDSHQEAAYALSVEGAQMVGGLHDRVRMARDMFDGRKPPVGVAVSVESPLVDADERLRTFLSQNVLF
jgi:exosortase A